MLSGMFYAPSQQYYINPVTGSYMFGNKVIDRKDYINKTAFGDIRPRPTVKINYDYVYEYKKNDPNTKINERYENISIDMDGATAQLGSSGSSSNTNIISNNYYIYNNTDKTVWYKPESSSAPVALEPGEKTNERIDGLTHPSHPNQVYKVRDYFESIFGITVNENGITLSRGISIYPSFGGELNWILGGGWYNDWNSLGENWKPLFELSKP